MISLCIFLTDQPLVHEPRGEVVEQLGVAGGFGLHAQVVGRADEALAEMVHPDAVDHDAGGERVVLAGDGLGEFEAAAALA